MNIVQWILSLFQWPEVEPISHVSDDCLTLIRRYEGCRLKAYHDPVGVLTIGYGHTGPDVTEGMTITQAQADQMLRMRIGKEFLPGVLSVVTPSKQCHLDAMVSLAYNIGVGAFKKSTLARKYAAGDIKGAALEFPRWDKAAGKSLKGLRRRRAAEQALFRGAKVEDAIAIGDAHA